MCVYARMHFITIYRNTKYKAKLPKITAQTLHVKHAAHSARNEPTLFHPAPLSPVRPPPDAALSEVEIPLPPAKDSSTTSAPTEPHSSLPALRRASPSQRTRRKAVRPILRRRHSVKADVSYEGRAL